MSEPKHLFHSFRAADQEYEALLPEDPPNVLCKLLENAHVHYEMVIYRLERDEASIDPQTSDLYPNGPLSGPSFVFLYDFITTSEHFRKAHTISGNAYPESVESQS